MSIPSPRERASIAPLEEAFATRARIHSLTITSPQHLHPSQAEQNVRWLCIRCSNECLTNLLPGVLAAIRTALPPCSATWEGMVQDVGSIHREQDERPQSEVESCLARAIRCKDVIIASQR